MADVHGGDITQEGTRGTRIKDRGERGTLGKVPHQPTVKCLEEKVNVSTPQRVE